MGLFEQIGISLDEADAKWLDNYYRSKQVLNEPQFGLLGIPPKLLPLIAIAGVIVTSYWATTLNKPTEATPTPLPPQKPIPLSTELPLSAPLAINVSPTPTPQSSSESPVMFRQYTTLESELLRLNSVDGLTCEDVDSGEGALRTIMDAETKWNQTLAERGPIVILRPDGRGGFRRQDFADVSAISPARGVLLNPGDVVCAKPE